MDACLSSSLMTVLSLNTVKKTHRCVNSDTRTHARTHLADSETHKNNRNTIWKHTHAHTRGQQNHINNETLMEIHKRLEISLQKLKWPISRAFVVIIHSHRDTRLSQTRTATFSDALCISPIRLVGRFFSAKSVYERAQNHRLGAYACVCVCFEFPSLWLRYRSATKERRAPVFKPLTQLSNAL